MPRTIDKWFELAILALLLGILAGRAVVHLLLKSPWLAVPDEERSARGEHGVRRLEAHGRNAHADVEKRS